MTLRRAKIGRAGGRIRIRVRGKALSTRTAWRLAGVLALGFLFLWLWKRDSPRALGQLLAERRGSSASAEESARPGARPGRGGIPPLGRPLDGGEAGRGDATASRRRPRLALLFDDVGRDLARVERILRLPQPVAIAVLPDEPFSKQAAARAREAGLDVLCHLPMEPEGPENPGPGALMVGLPAEELERRILRALQAVPGAVGVNNHMGSRFTRHPEGMRVVLSVLARSDLFFIDSWTHPESVGPRLARELGVAYRVRDVFLDDALETVRIEAEVRRWLELARKEGSALAIAHPHDVTLDVLEQELPRALRSHELVSLSSLLERGPTGPSAARRGS